jgi:hypothetical protein
MKAGDLIHVPADVTLVRNYEVANGMDGYDCYVTKVPKKASSLREASERDSYCQIEYGEHVWLANMKDVTLVV